MKVGRRDLFKFAAGSVAGLAITPVPWKLLEDTALWSQNWSWIPRPPRGEIGTKFTACTLCPAGCAVRARCVGGQPVALAGVAEHPATRGVLCALGLAGHHLPYHPLRVRQALRGGRPVGLDTAAAEIAAALVEMRRSGSKNLVAVLDERPGRTASWLYRRWLADMPQGRYVTPPEREGATLAALAELIEGDAGPLGLDLERVRTILSFGAPVLDGWSTPGRVLRRRERFQIVQVETRYSRTAALADQWVPIRPGTEAAFALALAHVLIEERLYDEAAARRAGDFAAYRKVAGEFPPERVAGLSGVAAEQVIQTARLVAGRRPAIAVGGVDPGGGPLGREEEMAIGGLNLLLGGLERDGGIVRRRAVPAPKELEAGAAPVTEIQDLPNGSVGLLFIDASAAVDALPWRLVEQKLASGKALVVSLAAYRAGYAGHADYLIPAPMYLESLQDVPAPADAAEASFSLSTALVAPPQGVVEPVEFVGRVTGNAGTLSDWIKRRAAAVYRTGRGTVTTYTTGKVEPLAEVGSAEKFWNALTEGACWQDERVGGRAAPGVALLGRHGDGAARLRRAAAGRLDAGEAPAGQYPLVLAPFGWRGATGNTALSPVMSKVYQESGLRRAGNQAAVHPATGAACGLTDGCRGVIETQCGSCGVAVFFDPAVMPGVIQVAVGPEPPRTRSVLEVCDLEGGCSWRAARARIWKV